MHISQSDRVVYMVLPLYVLPGNRPELKRASVSPYDDGISVKEEGNPEWRACYMVNGRTQLHTAVMAAAEQLAVCRDKCGSDLSVTYVSLGIV